MQMHSFNALVHSRSARGSVCTFASIFCLHEAQAHSIHLCAREQRVHLHIFLHMRCIHSVDYFFLGTPSCTGTNLTACIFGLSQALWSDASLTYLQHQLSVCVSAQRLPCSVNPKICSTTILACWTPGFQKTSLVLSRVNFKILKGSPG
jgi:hypothetical protein